MHGLLDVDALVEGLLTAVIEAVPSDFISINDISFDVEHVISVVRPDLPKALYAKFGLYAHENPLLQNYLKTLDGRAYRFSDVTTVEDYHSLDLYREVYSTIGVEHQMAFMLQSPPERVLAIVLSRKDNNFTDAERDLVDRARPFLIQAWSSAIEYSAMRDELVAQSRGTRPVPELVERGLTERQAEVMVLAVHGRSNRATAEALGLSERTVQKHLERCYRTLGVSGRSDAADLVRSLIAESAATPELKRRGLDGHPPAQPPD